MGWGKAKKSLISLRDPKTPFGVEIKYSVGSFHQQKQRKNADLELGENQESVANTHVRDIDHNGTRAGDAPLIPQPGLYLCPFS